MKGCKRNEKDVKKGNKGVKINNRERKKKKERKKERFFSC
jgi:hypothetical protein